MFFKLKYLRISDVVKKGNKDNDKNEIYFADEKEKFMTLDISRR